MLRMQGLMCWRHHPTGSLCLQWDHYSQGTLDYNIPLLRPQQAERRTLQGIFFPYQGSNYAEDLRKGLDYLCCCLNCAIARFIEEDPDDEIMLKPLLAHIHSSGATYPWGYSSCLRVRENGDLFLLHELSQVTELYTFLGIPSITVQDLFEMQLILDLIQHAIPTIQNTCSSTTSPHLPWERQARSVTSREL